jgi:hypothetical protein
MESSRFLKKVRKNCDSKDEGEGGGFTIERNDKISDEWNFSETEWKKTIFNGNS